MSNFTEDEECYYCHDIFIKTVDTGNPEGNYGYCIGCGRAYRTVRYIMPLDELNEERKECDLPPYDESPVKQLPPVDKDYGKGDKYNTKELDRMVEEIAEYLQTEANADDVVRVYRMCV